MADGFTIDEYEVTLNYSGAISEVDLDGPDISYDFSVHATCDTGSDQRDVTFMLDGSTDPAMTITTGGHGGIVFYPLGFPSLDEVTDVEEDYGAYAREDDPAFPMSLNNDEYYGLVDAGSPDHFIILQINNVDTVNDIVDFDYIIVRKISIGTH